MNLRERIRTAKNTGLNPLFTVSVQLTAQQYDRILQLVMLMGLDPDADFARVAQQVICDSLDMRIDSRIEAEGRYK